MSSSLEIPRFRQENLNPRLAAGDEGDAFQRFAAEVLAFEFPGLHAFPGRGKDGCIDLVCPADRPDSAFECKAIGSDGLEAAETRWREVAGKLSRNLADPSGPPAGEPQFEPWYRADLPIRRYVFCVSSRLRNERERQALLDRIHVFFENLTARHGHLRHLARLQVLLRDWGDFEALLGSRPHLLFRWFPNARPHGLIPLGEEPTGSRFSEYLTSARLPYYSRRKHLDLHPAPIPDEAGLLASFESERVNGLVITGGGGFGKTRLMLELGHQAQEAGWAVFRVQGRLRSDSLEQLADRLRPGTPALLLVDYVETQPAYEEVMETLNLLVDERQIPLRYIACCRSSFYSAVQLIENHQRVDLFPQQDPASSSWFDDFRNSTVRHIVEKSGVPSPARVIEMSRATPVLAVFAAWLHDRDRGSDLHELLSEPDFGTWVHKRVRQSFPDPTVAVKLGALVALFPLPERAVEELDNLQAELLDRLAQDGWVERRMDEGTREIRWEAVQDALTDQVLSSYLLTIQASSSRFVRKVFQEASRLGCIDSALAAFQRLGSHPVLAHLDWSELISESLGQAPSAWRTAHLELLRSPLLEDREGVRILGRTMDIQAESLETEGKMGLVRSYVSKSLAIHGRQPKAHLLTSTWLDVGGERDLVRSYVVDWLSTYGTLLEAQFVLKSWLDAGGERDLVRSHVVDWLSTHGTLPEAQFVLKSWLDAGGENDLVRSHVINWLLAHGAEHDAGSVLTSWLDAGGEREWVRPFVFNWLSTHSAEYNACFVMRSWLLAGGDRYLMTVNVINWLRYHGAAQEAGSLIHSWLGAGGERDLMRPSVVEWLSANLPEAHYLLKSWLEAGGERELVQSSIVQWLSTYSALPEARLVLTSWLDAGGEKDLVRSSVVEWLLAHGAEYDACFVLSAWLNAGGERNLVRSFVADWLSTHGDEQEAESVLRAWLDAGGDVEAVREAVAHWLSTQRRFLEA